MHARNEISVGEKFISSSFIGSEFEATILKETTEGDRVAIIPTVAGTAWITGTHQIMLDPSDPWPEGYRLSDTWPMD